MEDLMRSTHYAEQRSAPRSAPRSITELRAALLGEVVAPDDPDVRISSASGQRRSRPATRADRPPCRFR